MRQRIEEFVADLMADRRKAILLGSLLIVAVGMWFRYGMQSGGPQTAQATPQQTTGGESAAALDDAFAELTKVREQLAAGVKTIRRAGYSDRDVFTLHPEHFPLPESANASDQVDPKSPVVFVETPEERAEREKESLIRRVTEEADRLRLRSTCLLYTSPSPRDATLSRMPSSA